MSTHALIAATTGDIARAIYVHSEGYPDGVGRILRGYYQEEAKILKLIELGNLSKLRPNIFMPDRWYDFTGIEPGEPPADCCQPHGGDQERATLCYRDEVQRVASEKEADFAYFYNDGRWWAARSDDTWGWDIDIEWQPLEDLIAAATCKEG